MMDIEKLAREAQCGHEAIDLQWITPDGLERFAALVLQEAAQHLEKAGLDHSAREVSAISRQLTTPTQEHNNG